MSQQTAMAPPPATGPAITEAVRAVHEGGKLAVAPTAEVRDRPRALAGVHPGVAQVCAAIHAQPSLARSLTIKNNSVAVVSDGSAVLGLGDIGPEAAMPVMEGKALLLKQLADVDGNPICLDARDPDRIVDIAAAIAPGFGGINLEDISAPRCFEIEGKLRRRVPIPVFHDDQHGTAIVVLAALRNAVRLVGRTVGPGLRIVVQGIGAAGIAVSELLLAAAVTDLVGVDRGGIVTARRSTARDPISRRLGKRTNPRELTGHVDRALEGADVFIGVSAGNTVTVSQLELMARRRIVFAMANPVPEIDPHLARAHATVVATGRSDQPNQINNVLCFPGLFRGLLDAGATRVSTAMKLAAADAIASLIGDDELTAEHIVPSPLDQRVVPAVAGAVADVAWREGAVAT